MKKLTLLMFVFSILIGLEILDTVCDRKRQNDLIQVVIVDFMEKYPTKKINRISDEKIDFFIGCDDDSNIK